ncbi:Transposable element Tc1 transposase [Folsomia candida]|uniref:Transposable element Tc1 transposase n=1 Tax=Folsomia candida TaxID=158441 RepID=A0A226DUJ5_FOLCA|nr:Transposable element Tc1 transposase [Folsomia candida]
MIREILISYNTRHFYYADKYFSTYYKWDRVKKRLVASNKTHIWVVRLTGMLHFAYVTAQLWTILLNSSHTFLERWTGALVSLTYLFELGFRAEWKADPRVLQLVNCVVQGHTLNHEKYDGVDTQGNSYRYSRSCHSGLEGWTKRGLSQRQIWTKYKLARTTIQTIIKNFKANGSVQNKVRSGRKPILAHREVRHVLNKVNVTPSLSAPKLSTEIKEMFGKQSSPEASYCTEECNQTSEVCQRPHFQATNILGHILWTDESKFNVFGSDGRRRVWRYPKEALNPKNLNPTVKHGGGSVMVWGCMASRICSKTWTWTTICLPTRQRSETLCQVHHGILQEKKIPKLEWPPQSPDLNPIEHLCNHIEREIRKQSFSGIPGLKSRIREVWETISEDVTKNLVNSMTRRLEAVLKANGGPTKY